MLTPNPNPQPPSCFVVGTDTEIGKTIVTGLLALRLQMRGVDTGVMKPFASGCDLVDGELQSEDARWLKAVTGVEDELELINPARWREPLTPLVAAKRENDNSDYWSRAANALRTLQSRHETVVVEGVGGLLAPIAEVNGKVLTNADWASELELPVVLVARRVLGTINHTLLTVEVLRARGIQILGLVFCDPVEVEQNNVAAQTSPDLIAQISGLKILGEVPFLKDLSRESQQIVARDCFSDFLCA